MKHLLSLRELSRQEIESVFQLADQARARPGALSGRLRGKTLALLFEKPSTRTRVALEVAMANLGGATLFLRREDTQLGRGESIADTARVLSKLVDGIVARVHAHQDVLDLARYGSVPVVNGLSDSLHPLQALADLYTLRVRCGRTDGLKLAYVGDGNNVCCELIFGAVKLGLAICAACPAGHEPNATVVKLAAREAQKLGTPTPVVGDDLLGAVSGAHAVYTDVWTSMGGEGQEEERRRVFQGFTVTPALLGAARPDVVFLHPMPARRGEEVAAEVFDGPQSLALEQVRNRVWVCMALLALLLGPGD